MTDEASEAFWDTRVQNVLCSNVCMLQREKEEITAPISFRELTIQFIISASWQHADDLIHESGCGQLSSV